MTTKKDFQANCLKLFFYLVDKLSNAGMILGYSREIPIVYSLQLAHIGRHEEVPMSRVLTEKSYCRKIFKALVVLDPSLHN